MQIVLRDYVYKNVSKLENSNPIQIFKFFKQTSFTKKQTMQIEIQILLKF